MFLSGMSSLPQIGDLFPCPQHQSNPGRQGAPFPSSFSRRLRVIPQRTREPGTPPAPTMQPGTAELLRSVSGQCVQPWVQNVGLSLYQSSQADRLAWRCSPRKQYIVTKVGRAMLGRLIQGLSITPEFCLPPPVPHSFWITSTTSVISSAALMEDLLLWSFSSKIQVTEGYCPQGIFEKGRALWFPFWSKTTINNTQKWLPPLLILCWKWDYMYSLVDNPVHLVKRVDMGVFVHIF